MFFDDLNNFNRQFLLRSHSFYQLYTTYPQFVLLKHDPKIWIDNSPSASIGQENLGKDVTAPLGMDAPHAGLKACVVEKDCQESGNIATMKPQWLVAVEELVGKAFELKEPATEPFIGKIVIDRTMPRIGCDVGKQLLGGFVPGQIRLEQQQLGRSKTSNHTPLPPIRKGQTRLRLLHLLKRCLADVTRAREATQWNRPKAECMHGSGRKDISPIYFEPVKYKRSDHIDLVPVEPHAHMNCFTGGADNPRNAPRTLEAGMALDPDTTIPINVQIANVRKEISNRAGLAAQYDRLAGLLPIGELAVLIEKHGTQQGKSGQLKYLDCAYWICQKLIIAHRLELDNSEPKRVVDIGMGGGHFSFVLQHFGHETVGIDIANPVYEDICKTLGVKRITQAVALGTPLAVEGRFDLVTAFAAQFFKVRGGGIWSTNDWKHFLRDLIDLSMRSPGRIYFTLNRMPRDANHQVNIADVAAEFGGRYVERGSILDIPV